MVQTEKVWEAADDLRLPRLVVLNRLDRERASLDAIARIAPRGVQPHRDSRSAADRRREELPGRRRSGDEEGLRVQDRRKRHVHRRRRFRRTMTGAVDAAREALIEMVAEADEKLMEKFFEAGTLTDEELVAGLRSATAAAKIFPLVCTSALVNIGVPQLLDAIVNYLPSPADRPYAGVDKRRQRRRVPGRRQEAAAGVRVEDDRRSVRRPHHDVSRDRRARSRPTRPSTTRRATRQERLGHVALLQGKTQTNVPEIKAGDLGAVAKLKDTLTNDTLGDKAEPGDVSGHRVPRTGALVRDRAEDARRRGQDQHVDAPPRGRGSVDQVQPRSADQGAAPVRPGTAAHRGHGRQAEAALRRRRQPEAAAHSLPRDDQGRRPKRTAATRSRPAATASSATARSRSSRCRAARISSSSTTSSADRSRGSSSRPSRRASRMPGRAATWPAIRWSISA